MSWWREFARGFREGAESGTPATPQKQAIEIEKDQAARALDAATELARQANELPLGSDARVTLQRLAEELRAFAAGERAKESLADALSAPAIRQILKNANIKVD